MANRVASPPSRVANNGCLISQSRRFQLEYDVEATSAAGVYRVEVWYTDDGGRTWRHHGDDEDRCSPYLVAVDEDGMYGFRLLVQAREGLAARPPRAGDPADIWIRVDAEPPVARITSARYGRGNQLGSLQINWDAKDEDLSDHPVTLLYGSHPEGPWRKIAANLPNTGRYDWRADDRAPAQIYLRLEVVDRAGNVGSDTLLEPIRSEGLAPRGFIRQVRPIEHQDFSQYPSTNL